MNNDLINGCFELFGGILLLLNVRRLYHDKNVRGVSVVTMSFFTLWGYWNLYYYPSLNQPLSLIGGVFLVAVSTVWVGMVAYYYRHSRRKGT